MIMLFPFSLFCSFPACHCQPRLRILAASFFILLKVTIVLKMSQNKVCDSNKTTRKKSKLTCARNEIKEMRERQERVITKIYVFVPVWDSSPCKHVQIPTFTRPSTLQLRFAVGISQKMFGSAWLWLTLTLWMARRVHPMLAPVLRLGALFNVTFEKYPRDLYVIEIPSITFPTLDFYLAVPSDGGGT
ncbi:hypothetical protein BJ165DRAFT_1408037 [Panaeolus papilionaceus]|nr:hypothetical protein BJ165DRAFT_1408037 [Panaeolus papilionaceus]